MKTRSRVVFLAAAAAAVWGGVPGPIAAIGPGDGRSSEQTPAFGTFDPGTVLWYRHPADKWENALPVGNGRLAAMVFGKTDEERIQFNEETYWTGGPYSQTVKGGAEALPEIRRLIFAGEFLQAHKLFGRRLMGYPVEQQKYQSLGDVILRFDAPGPVSDYRHELDLGRAVVTTRFVRDGTAFTRQVFASAADQVVVIRLTADRPGRVFFRAELRGARNEAHSHCATDYFRMDGEGKDALIVRGKSADYLGVPGRLRTMAKLKVAVEGGTLSRDDAYLFVRGADAATLVLAAATNFVDFKDVGGDESRRVEETLGRIRGKTWDRILFDHVRDYERLFGRVKIDFGATPDSNLPTDERLRRFAGADDPALGALVFQFGRYVLISSSRPGTQPANLQGKWNDKMNPPWDSKYTTNINTEMNYWPAEVANLGECAEPLFRMIRELVEQGREVAREHYGARGWVLHQNTDLWRVAAPMDGPDWGAFTTGGAWLCAHLWEHYLYTGDRGFLEAAYPLMKGSAEFFLDFLVEHPEGGRLVTNPSTSPENFPDRPGNDPFFDEVCAWMSPGTTICAGSTIDLRILDDLFGAVAESALILGRDASFRERVLDARRRLPPMRIGRGGDLQEWLDDWGQKEKSHRHISNLYGLFPGRGVSARRTPGLAAAAEAVLEQRGLEGNGWASAWKAACWARLGRGGKAMDHFAHYLGRYAFDNLFAICSNAFQVDGALGMTAAIAEMLLQSHEDEIVLLPALPSAWKDGAIDGLLARGGFEVGLKWKAGRPVEARLASRLGRTCRIRSGGPFSVASGGRPVPISRPETDLVEFVTEAGKTYLLSF
jgi:alpha-L-fucosidase 2